MIGKGQERQVSPALPFGNNSRIDRLRPKTPRKKKKRSKKSSSKKKRRKKRKLYVPNRSPNVDHSDRKLAYSDSGELDGMVGYKKGGLSSSIPKEILKDDDNNSGILDEKQEVFHSKVVSIMEQALKIMIGKLIDSKYSDMGKFIF